ncbi:MAG: hypothetical protein ACR2FO_03390, partial [Actinomycetota bacterium]
MENQRDLGGLENGVIRRTLKAALATLTALGIFPFSPRAANSLPSPPNLSPRAATLASGDPAQGTVQTVAGPGLCTGREAMRPQSQQVGALAVGGANQIFVDTGPPVDGLIRRADGVTTTFLRTGAPLQPRRTSSSPDRPPAENRLAPDGKGGVYVTTGARVLRLDGKSNSIQTVAGSDFELPRKPSSGDGGRAEKAQFSRAQTIATDEKGNLFVSDVFDVRKPLFRIRFINRGDEPVTFYRGTGQELTIGPGDISTIAGTPGRLDSNDGQFARKAVIWGGPASMAVVSDKLYLGLDWTEAETKGKHVGVRVINLGGLPLKVNGTDVGAGKIQKIAGGRLSGFRGDGGPARSAAFSHIPGMAADQQGNLYVADEFNHRVRRIDGRGIVTTVAGIGRPGFANGGFNGNNRPATNARLNQPFDVEIGNEGVYVADRKNGQVRLIDHAGTIRLAPGNAESTVCSIAALQTSQGRHNDWGGSGDLFRTAGPYDVEVDGKGHVYFAYLNGLDSQQALVELSGSSISGLQPSATQITSETSGKSAKRRTGYFDALAMTAQGRLYVNEGPGGQIRLVNLTPKPLFAHGIKVGPRQSEVVAGTGKEGIGGDGGPAKKARFSPVSFGPGGSPDSPWANNGMVADEQGNLFVADVGNQRIRIINSRGVISTVAGEGGPPELQECCRAPFRIAEDGQGNLYVSRRADPVVFLINRGPQPLARHGQVVGPGKMTVVAGNGTYGLAAEGDKAVEAPIRGPLGMAVDDKGNLYIARSVDHSVVRVDANGIL